MSTNQAPQPKYLKDYKAPEFKINFLKLDFKINETETIVKTVTEFECIEKSTDNLVLAGENLILKSIKIDGNTLPEERYELTKESLIIKNVRNNFTLETIVEIHPETNTALEGLYKSSGTYCTQCEPEGFRKITYYLDRPDVMTNFTTRIEADKATCPILLSNGNCVEKGDLENGRHFTVWQDPFAKPCYLFALVAGDLAHIHDKFMTMNGKVVDLYIYVNHGNQDKCAHAMESLKKAMKWDEKTYGREYDLNIFNVVAVDDFNFGAMENKSLNIFNSKLVLANPETATDTDFLSIESVIAHEYFHNWTGDRITCRDWFQLSLKEGLTVFRDQCFSSDMNSESVERIDNVNSLRTIQFAEDASPMAHPIRPESYIEMNNFYTATVYDKGAEVIRMIHILLGKENFRKATDLYFERHDGQAVTCEDFVKCMEDASGINLQQFRLWYSQAGTPRIKVKSNYDEASQKFTLIFEQTIPDTAGQTNKKPMHIPIATGLLDHHGKDMLPETTRVLELKEAKQEFVFENIAQKPIPSILRGFSAPVRMETDLTDENLLFLMAHDSDGFNRWDAGQIYLQKFILSKAREIPEELLEAFYKLITDKKSDKALIAKALSLPSENYLAQLMPVVDVEGIYESRKFVLTCIAHKYLSELQELYHDNLDKSYDLSPESIGKRSLKNIALRYIKYGDSDNANFLAFAQYEKARNMTDKVAAISLLSDEDTNFKELAFETFYNQYQDNNLVIDKWFALQAISDRKDVPEIVMNLLQHTDFTYKNPNRLCSLIGNFSLGNHRWFHRKDGTGYKLLADVILKVNDINPSTAARLATPFKSWKNYDSSRKSLMESELKRILSYEGVSKDVYEIVSRSLG